MDTPLASMPSNWRTAEIRALALSLQPGFARQPNESGKGHLQLRMPSISRSGFIDFTVSKFVEATEEERTKYAVQRGDVIFNNTNSPDLVGNAAVFDHDVPCVLSNHMTRIRVNQRVVAPGFLAAVLHSYWRTGQTQKRSKQWINQAAIDTDNLASFRIPLPPLSEQQRIVEILQETEEIRRLRTEAETKTSQLVPAIYAQMFLTSKERNHWKEATIADIAADHDNAIRTGPFGSDLLHSEFVNSGIPVLGIDNAVSNRFRWEERRYITPSKFSDLQRFRVFPDDVMITIMGTVGRVAIAPPDLPESISTKHLCVITPDKRKVLSTFLWATLLHDPSVRAQTKAVAKGAIMEGWNSTIIRRLRFPIPPLELQQEFREQVGEALSLESTDLEKKQALALTASISSYTFSGQLTERWRNANRRQLAREAAVRDEELEAQTGLPVLVNFGMPSTREWPEMYEIPDELNREQKHLLINIRTQWARRDFDEYFTAEMLGKSLDGPLRRNPHAIEGHLVVLAVRGLIIPISREEQTEDTGEFVFGNAYRLPLRNRKRNEEKEGESLVGDYARLRELERLAAQLEKKRALT